MSCIECEKIKQGKYLVYEDSSVIAMLSERPAAKGHVILFPKEHYAIIEQMPDELIGHMLSAANRISAACFRAAGAEGTNILINNGIAAGQKTGHASINIIPRAENDGLNLQWQTATANEDDLKTAQLILKDELEGSKKPEEIKEENQEEVILEETPEEENYLLKQLERIP